MRGEFIDDTVVSDAEWNAVRVSAVSIVLGLIAASLVVMTGVHGERPILVLAVPMLCTWVAAIAGSVCALHRLIDPFSRRIGAIALLTNIAAALLPLLTEWLRN